MALRRFELAPLVAALYASPYTPADFAQLRDRCGTDLPSVAADLTVLLVTVYRDCPALATERATLHTTDTADTSRVDACITTAATVIAAADRANRTGVQDQPGS
ncbi:hypothetical protein LWC34_21985 [Kibdelosporangium philippinense]|uniref:Uncharacterized protein n=1 Tax=Kibdelosporangium philippinense TaxID=211113 RepID=A0ABS8ZI08_9PSEU|nr:hypothetical protein [Kibdelosporangium philippinense]MCE7005472.1 hypothetical protein [Kibdelosporangium philippinense]